MRLKMVGPGVGVLRPEALGALGVQGTLLASLLWVWQVSEATHLLFM